MSTFLDQAEIAVLTGRKFKNRRIFSLQPMAIPFLENATGYPVMVHTLIYDTGLVEGE